MVSSRALRRGVMTLAVFAAGIAAAVALHDRLYANAALAVIAGLWLSLLSLADPPAAAGA
jgi:hypothetical protein